MRQVRLQSGDLDHKESVQGRGRQLGASIMKL